jgi:hypothetical protein
VGEWPSHTANGVDVRVGWSEREQRAVDAAAREEQRLKERAKHRQIAEATKRPRHRSSETSEAELAARVAYLYLVQGLTLRETGEQVGWSAPKVASILRQHGLPVRSRGARSAA